MKNLKTLIKPIQTRKLSIDGKIYETPFFNTFLFRLKDNQLTIKHCFGSLITSQNILTIELSNEERDNFQQLCSNTNNMLVDLEERLSSQKLNYKNVFSVEEFKSFSPPKDLFIFEIHISKHLPDNHVIDLNFILNHLEKVISF